MVLNMKVKVKSRGESEQDNEQTCPSRKLNVFFLDGIVGSVQQCSCDSNGQYAQMAAEKPIQVIAAGNLRLIDTRERIRTAK